MSDKLKLLSAAIFYLLLTTEVTFSQCTLTNSTGCVCADSTTSDCDLLPDIAISWYALENYQGGPTEYSQTGNGANNGKLRITGSTPNTGFGPLEVRSIDSSGNKMIVCGTDTFFTPAGSVFTCPNGQTPKQILRQIIYHKNGSTMSTREHLTPPMTYSNTSMYVDEWGIFSLRIPLVNDPNPKNWPVVGSGKKRAFCLMNYGSCSTYANHCRDSNTVYQGGTPLLDPDFPNWGLGSNYNCSATEQGIASGYTDIYSENLDGMWITIPPGTCNGNYWIYYEVDPNNYFEESNENNNYSLIPFTLTLQNAPGNPEAIISSARFPMVCGNDSITLKANAGYSYLWSNGATSQQINAGPGIYLVTVSNYCGTAVSDTFTISSYPTPPAPVTTPDTVCVGQQATLLASGSNVIWYDSLYNLIGNGNSFTTPVLTSSTTYFTKDINSNPGVLNNLGKPDSAGGGGYFTGQQSLLFTAYKPIMLKSVKVYANSAGTRTVEVYNSTGQMIISGQFYVPAGESRINLNFEIPAGVNSRITVAGNPDLWRNNSNVNYPYTITDTLSITGSTAGQNLYYFFYDWEIEVGKYYCESPVTPVTAEVEVCAGTEDLVMNNLIQVYPVPAQEKINIEIFPVIAENNAQLKLIDITGREIYSGGISLEKNIKFKKEVDITTFSKGTFIVVLRIHDREYYRRVTKL